MTWTELHWIEGPWPGKLALAARPRGGDWLSDEIASWQQAGVDTIFSLLTSDEEKDLDIRPEEAIAGSRGMRFLRLPIPDREVPPSEEQLSESLGKLQAELEMGRNVVLHCRQGIGRTGLVAACLFVSNGTHPDVGCAATQHSTWRARARNAGTASVDRSLRPRSRSSP